MVGFVDAPMPICFTVVHFKRWIMKATLCLTTMHVFVYLRANLRGNSLLSRRRSMV
jgi:hypothetical protein